MMLKKFSGKTIQTISAISVNLLSCTLGCLMGWSSSSMDFLGSDESDLVDGKISPEYADLIDSMFPLGGFFGVLLYSYLVEKIGRNMSTKSITILQCTSLAFVAFGNHSTHILISRFFAGTSAGATYVAIPLFVSEISEPDIRGALGTLFVVMVGMGLSLAYIIGPAMRYDVCVWVYTIFTIFFLITSLRLQETPYFLLKVKKLEKAKKSLMFYRGTEPATFDDNEFNSMKEYVEQVDASPHIKFSDFTTKASLRSIVIGIVMVWLEQYCGCYILLFSMESIFNRLKSQAFSTYMGTVIVSLIQILGSILAFFTIDRFGRKFLYSTAPFGVAISMIIYGISTQLLDAGSTSKFVEFLPVFALSTSIFLANVGIFSLTFVILSEISPDNIKSEIFMICETFSFIFSFTVFMGRSFLENLLGISGTMYFFAFNSILGGLFGIFYMPETKGKTFEEISRIMSK